MKNRILGSLSVSAMGLGCMGFSHGYGAVPTEAESIRLTYEAQATGLKYLSQANIQESVLRLRGIDALKDVADGRATKIFMPTDLSDVVSGIGAIGETLGVGDAEPIDKSSEPIPAPPTDPCHGDSASKITQEINAQKRDAWLQQNTRG